MLLAIPFLFLFIALIELMHNSRPSSPLRMKGFGWENKQSKDILSITGCLEIYNPHPHMEIMIPELEVKPLLDNANTISEKMAIMNRELDKTLPKRPKLKMR